MLATAAGVVLFAWLGVWQLHRAAEKEALLAAFAGAQAKVPVTLSQARRMPADGHYPHVRLHGRYRLQHDYVLDDQVRDGQQGVIVFSPFMPDDGALGLLVNRGFIAKDESARVPVIPAAPAGEVELTGLYAPTPGIGLRLGGNALPGQANWPKLAIYIDTDEIGEDLGQRIDSRVILLDAEAGSGFMREWTPQIIPPERHLGYAVQWFGFLLTTLVIFIVLHWRRDNKGSP
jgi:cytochrome oxidase assembly protein ShyY1